MGAALAATGPLRSSGFDSGCRRGQDPSHISTALAPAANQARPLWERPWPRQGHCAPQASIQAAVGVKTPPTEPSAGSGRESRAIPVGAALAATGRSQSSGFDSGCRRGQDLSHRTPPWLRPRIARDPCGSGLGRDRAVAVLRLRCRLPSGSEDPSHRSTTRAPAANRASQMAQRAPRPR